MKSNMIDSVDSSQSSDDSESECEDSNKQSLSIEPENEGIPMLSLVDDEESGLLVQQPPSIASECGLPISFL